VDGVKRPPKSLLGLEPNAAVTLDLPGGGGYGDPAERDAESVLRDVVYGYISLAAAEAEYKVAVRYVGAPDALVRMPEHYAIDVERTRELRGTADPAS
jgi:N-methylhydantoinase B